jgi:hypothetical protein
VVAAAAFRAQLPSAAHGQGQVPQPAQDGGGLPFRRAGEGDVGEVLGHGTEDDLRFEPCERGSETEVDAVAEGQVAGGLPVDADLVRLRAQARVAVGGAQQKEYGRPRRDGGPG